MFKRISLILAKFSDRWQQASLPNSVSNIQCIDSTNQYDCERAAFSNSLTFSSYVEI
nr:hypothetical protein [Plesiomonas shigelloides]